MRNVHRGNAYLFLDVFNHIAHLYAKFRVQIGQRFVHQQDFGMNDDCPCQCNTLLLAAGELGRHTIRILVYFDHLQDFISLAVTLCFRNLSGFQSVGYIIPNGHMRENSIVLKNHAHVSAVGGDVVDYFPVNQNFPGFYGVEADNHSQQGGFSASRWPQKCKELSRFNLGGKPLDDNITAVCFCNIIDLY